MQAYLKGLYRSLVIALGYFPVAVAFGVTALKMGLDPLEATAASVLVFAGASQFMLVALWSKGTGILMTGLIMFLINLRHIFYGPTLLSGTSKKQRYLLPLVSFGLTDEVYATSIVDSGADADVDSSSASEDMKIFWMAGLETGAYLSWISGTAVGAVIGDQLLRNHPVIESTLSFALPALFLSLFLGIFDSRNSLTLVFSSVPVIILQLLGHTSAAVISGIVAGIAASWIKERMA